MIRPIPVLIVGALLFAGLGYANHVAEECEDGTIVRGVVGFECVEESP